MALLWLEDNCLPLAAIQQRAATRRHDLERPPREHAAAEIAHDPSRPDASADSRPPSPELMTGGRSRDQSCPQQSRRDRG
jgi:hypothetical protein